MRPDLVLALRSSYAATLRNWLVLLCFSLNRTRMEVWGNLLEAMVLCEQWRQRYNEIRPHGSLKMMTPSAYAARARERGDWRQTNSEG